VLNSSESLYNALCEARDLATRYLYIIALVAIGTTPFLHVKLNPPMR
jgi:hypothetical protein